MYKLVLRCLIIGALCTTSCVSNYSSNIEAEEYIQAEEYILSRHIQGNKLVYFFIDKINVTGDFYAYIISDKINEDQWANISMEFSSEGSTYPDNWYNKYSPIVIQNDFNAISMAAFSLQPSIMEIKILAQLINKVEDTINIRLSPIEITISNDPVQYYVVQVENGNMPTILKIERDLMEDKLNKATNFATQLGNNMQLGFIKGP